jgi:hypothetical protein
MHTGSSPSKIFADPTKRSRIHPISTAYASSLVHHGPQPHIVILLKLLPILNHCHQCILIVVKCAPPLKLLM